jgi:hypothetical protein
LKITLYHEELGAIAGICFAAEITHVRKDKYFAMNIIINTKQTRADT